MKLYLDTCCLNRPLDDKSQALVAVEAEAVLAILLFKKSSFAKRSQCGRADATRTRSGDYPMTTVPLADLTQTAIHLLCREMA